MTFYRFLFVLFSIICFFVTPSYSQVPQPAPLTYEYTETLTAAFWTGTLVPVATTTLISTTITHHADVVSTTLTATDSAATATYSNYQGMRQEAVNFSAVYALDLSLTGAGLVCTHPISSTWQLQPRLAFWLSIIFALVARTHEWLIAGALGAALSFSSLAALQGALQAWSGQAMGELDFFPILGILVGSLVIAVPLMNWSSTIRHLGLEKIIVETRHPGESSDAQKQVNCSRLYGSTRTVLVFWSLLISIGFFSVFIGMQPYLQGSGSTPWRPFVPYIEGTLFCQPDGSLDTTAGQLFGWQSFWVTTEFIEANNCMDPCPAAGINTTFRQSSELQSLSAAVIDRFYENRHNTASEQASLKFGIDYYKHLLIILPFILLQGVLQIAFFWRTSPQKARWHIYVWVSRISTKDEYTRKQYSARSYFGFYLALTFYLLSVSTIPLAVIGFLMNVVVTEIYLTWLPRSEKVFHVDQWGVFAILLLVLVAAIICRLDPGTRVIWQEDRLKAKRNFIGHQIREYERHGREPHDQRSCKSMGCEPDTDSDTIQFTSRMVKFITTVRSICEDEYKDAKATLKFRTADFILLFSYEWYLLMQFKATPYIKPVRRSKNQELRTPSSDMYEASQDTEFRWRAKEPQSIIGKARVAREKRISALWNELQQAKRDLLLKCGLSTTTRAGAITPDVESHLADYSDGAPLLSNAAPMSGQYVPGQMLVSHEDSNRRNQPGQAYAIPRRQVPISRSSSHSSSNSTAEMQQLAPIYPAMSAETRRTAGNATFSNALSELPTEDITARSSRPMYPATRQQYSRSLTRSSGICNGVETLP